VCVCVCVCVCVSQKAIAEHGNPHVELPSGPPFFYYADADAAAAHLAEAGFAKDGCTTTIVPQEWELPSASVLWQAMSVRCSASPTQFLIFEYNPEQFSWYRAAPLAPAPRLLPKRHQHSRPSKRPCEQRVPRKRGDPALTSSVEFAVCCIGLTERAVGVAQCGGPRADAPNAMCPHRCRTVRFIALRGRSSPVRYQNRLVRHTDKYGHSISRSAVAVD
jgi:hypothetical protein